MCNYYNGNFDISTSWYLFFWSPSDTIFSSIWPQILVQFFVVQILVSIEMPKTLNLLTTGYRSKRNPLVFEANGKYRKTKLLKKRNWLLRQVIKYPKLVLSALWGFY